MMKEEIEKLLDSMNCLTRNNLGGWGKDSYWLNGAGCCFVRVQPASGRLKLNWYFLSFPITLERALDEVQKANQNRNKDSQYDVSEILFNLDLFLNLH